jgi:RNA polymerase sigma factor for flagellar operon FliA
VTLQPAQEKADLWRVYKRGNDRAARDALIEKYAPLVRYVAGRLAAGMPPNIELGDLISYGVFGLIDAIDKFDPDRGVKFETYAVTRIRGAILDGLRALDWAPHSVRQKARELEQVYGRMEIEFGRPAEDREVAQVMGISLTSLHRVLADIQAAGVLSLDDLWPAEGRRGPAPVPIETLRDERAISPEENAEVSERRRILAATIKSLPEKERLVITLLYYEEMTAKEVSLVLKVSQSRVSQLHSKAMLRLRGKLARTMEGLV